MKKLHQLDLSNKNKSVLIISLMALALTILMFYLGYEFGKELYDILN